MHFSGELRDSRTGVFNSKDFDKICPTGMMIRSHTNTTTFYPNPFLSNDTHN